MTLSEQIAAHCDRIENLVADAQNGGCTWRHVGLEARNSAEAIRELAAQVVDIERHDGGGFSLPLLELN